MNFGNPYNPEVYYQFVYALKGMSDACLKHGTPVTGGNVSFYNQSEDGPVYPTPTIGMLGVLDSINDKMTLDFKATDSLIYMLGAHKDDIHCSDYLHHICGVTHSPAPSIDLEEEFAVQQKVLSLIKNKLIMSAHDVADGGLFITLLESAMPNGIGFTIKTSDAIRKDAYLFGEAQSRVVVSVAKEHQAAFEAHCADIAFDLLGSTTTSGAIEIDAASWGAVADWKTNYDSVIENELAS